MEQNIIIKTTEISAAEYVEKIFTWLMTNGLEIAFIIIGSLILHRILIAL